MTVQPTHADLAALLEARLAKLYERLDEEAKDRDAYRRQAADRDAAFRRTITVQGDAIETLEKAIGEEPDSDGRGGRGIIGDLRKAARQIDDLLGLQKVGKGVFAAIGVFFTVFGVFIVLGITKWILDLTNGGGG